MDYIEGVIDRIEGAYAVIVLADKQKINWPIDKLPPVPSEGQIVKLFVENDEEIRREREQLAKDVLNEILK